MLERVGVGSTAANARHSRRYFSRDFFRDVVDRMEGDHAGEECPTPRRRLSFQIRQSLARQSRQQTALRPWALYEGSRCLTRSGWPAIPSTTGAQGLSLRVIAAEMQAKGHEPAHPRSLICFASGVRAILRSSFSLWRRSRMVGGPTRARSFGQPAAHLPAHSRGRKRDLTGS
jgi:hypothetical protein